MSNSSHTTLYSSTNSSSSTLRPRTGRLISYVDDDNADATAITTSTSATPPRFPSRGVSPNEVTVTRSKSTDKPRHGRANNREHTRSSSGSQASAGKQTAWEPWGSLQGFASTFLGNEASSSSKDRATGSFRTPLWMKQDKNYTIKSSTPKWGPSTQSSSNPAQDALEERTAMVQAKKREALLLASVSENRDSLGRFKRRDSNADADTATTLADESEEALVYLHKVEKVDTMAGVVIKYNCPPEWFRKVNRFWPNDNIQTRTRVLVPLGGSTVKGRKVDSPYLSSNLIDESAGADTAQHCSTVTNPLTNGLHGQAQSSSSMSSSTPTVEPTPIITSISDETELKHDSWVMLPNFKEAVEVLRVPRRALGYFPRARRKSNTTLTVSSTTSTPKTSFDTLRHPPTHAAQQTMSLNASPVRRPTLASSRLNSSSRQRASSTTGPGNTFVDALRGPGGVGDLRGLRTEIPRPGPADDPLNRKFNQYFPDFLPPPEDMPRTGFARLSTSRGTPRASFDSVRSTRSNSNSSALPGDMGGTIEGWVRKMAGAPGKRDRSAAVDRMGDLIELETNSEVVVTERGDELGGGAEDITTPTASTARTSDFATEEALLNERFPVRGRVRNAYAGSSAASGRDRDD